MSDIRTMVITGGKEIWASKDGQRKIFQLEHDGEGDIFTYSDKLAEGGTFDVEVYEKASNREGYPPQKFARQQKKDKGWGGGSNWRPMTYEEAIELEQAKLPSMCMKWGVDTSTKMMELGEVGAKNFIGVAIKAAGQYLEACREMYKR